MVQRFQVIVCVWLLISPLVLAAGWQAGDWQVVASSSGAEKRSAPIRNIVRTQDGQLLGTRTTGSTIQLFSSTNNGIDWSHTTNVAESNTVVYGDPTLEVLDSGEILAGFRELHPKLGWSVRVSRSLNEGQSWSFGGTIHDWTFSENEFVGAPQFNILSDGTLQAYYDSEFVAPGGQQYIALKDGVFDSNSGLWNWSNERVVNTAGAGSAGVRDGLPTIVNLGPDLDQNGDRLMVVTEGIGVTNGKAYNLLRAFQVENGGSSQTDWDNLFDSRVIHRSLLLDADLHRYNAYAPYAIRLDSGPVLVAFSTDEVLQSVGHPADDASESVSSRHSEIKFIHTTTDFESWTAPETLWGVDHSQFVGDELTGDIFSYHIGLFELSQDDVLATLDLFHGNQVVFRPSLGQNSADFNKDGSVAGTDFLIWQQGFGLSGQTTTMTGDATGEGVVDAADLMKWGQQYGGSASLFADASVVPEPATMGQSLIALLMSCLLRHRGTPRTR